MSELYDSAVAIVSIKENIRVAINDKGVSCDKVVPFSEYPGLIAGVGVNLVNCRNDLGLAPQKGHKVLVSPLGQSGTLNVKFHSTGQKLNYGTLNVFPVSQLRLFNDTGNAYDSCGMYSWDGTALNAVYTSSNNNTDTYGNDSFDYGGIFLNQDLFAGFINQYDNTFNKGYWRENGRVAPIDNGYYTHNNYGIKKANAVDWELWDVNAAGEFTQLIATATGSFSVAIATCFYVFPGGTHAISLDNSCSLWTRDGSYLQHTNGLPELDAFKTYSTTHIIGGTQDGKFIILNRYSTSADESGIRNHPAILEVSEDKMHYTEVTSLNLSGLPLWYPWLGLLTMKDATGRVRVVRYSNGSWQEVAVDFGGQTFTSGRDGRVTLNADGSILCVNDSKSYNSGAVYVYNLAVSSSGYKAIPLSAHNFNELVVTGFCTGRNDTTTVEVACQLQMTA